MSRKKVVTFDKTQITPVFMSIAQNAHECIFSSYVTNEELG